MRAVDIDSDQATIYQRYGQLYGYPDTAVEAVAVEWADGQSSLLSNAEQDQIEKESGLPREAFFFRFSKAH